MGLMSPAGLKSAPVKKTTVSSPPLFMRSRRVKVKLPDAQGRFGPYGGKFVPEVLMPALAELEQAFVQACADKAFNQDFESLCRTYIGRPTPLYPATQLSAKLGGASILLKREDLAHTGAHKINNAIGQGLLAQRMS